MRLAGGEDLVRAGLAIVALVCALVGAWLARTPDPAVRTVVGPLPGTELVAWQLSPADEDEEPVGTALLLHGVTASAETMRPLGEKLARSGYRCVLLDVPGHGRSPGPVSKGKLIGAVVRAAAALSEPQRPRVDVLIGHSMGGYLAAGALEEGARARYVVSIGSRTAPATLAGTPALLISGALDPLLPPGELAALAAGARPEHDVEALAVAGCDHVLEPFHPTLVGAVVSRVVERLGGVEDAHPGGVWLRRCLGSALCLLAGLVALPVVVPRREQPPAAPLAAGYGLAAGATLLTGAALGIHGVFFYGLPGGAGWAGVPICVAGATLGSWVLTQAVARVVGWETPRVALAHGLGVGLCLGGGLLAMLVGARFPGMLLVLTGVAAGLGAGLGTWLARRARHPLVAHVLFGVCAGYVPGLWTRVFV